ncbi:MAG: dienelactone hydrolase family protein [Proteobacteria bacterium]|nr:dienelactone hydrolase family protein [Pseudomonadota bacterium]
MQRRLATIVVGLEACMFTIAPVAAQQIVKFPASQPNERKPIELRAELYLPKVQGPAPALVMMHGCSGWQPAVRYSLRDYAADMQSRGYVVLNLDSFGPRYYAGDEMCASNYQLQQALSYRTADAFDAARYLGAQPFVDRNHMFLMGQSNGGSVAMRAARADVVGKYAPSPADARFRGVAAFYPWCGVYQGTVKLTVPLQIFSGGQDTWTSAAECAALRTTGAPFDVVVYPQAAHSFDLEVITQKYQGFLIGKDPQAASDSRRRLTAFLAEYRYR